MEDKLSNSVEHIDKLIAEKKACISDKALLDYVELLFIRTAIVTEQIAVEVKISLDKATKGYKVKFDDIFKELKGLRKDLGYSNGNTKHK